MILLPSPRYFVDVFPSPLLPFPQTRPPSRYRHRQILCRPPRLDAPRPTRSSRIKRDNKRIISAPGVPFKVAASRFPAWLPVTNRQRSVATPLTPARPPFADDASLCGWLMDYARDGAWLMPRALFCIINTRRLTSDTFLSELLGCCGSDGVFRFRSVMLTSRVVARLWNVVVWLYVYTLICYTLTIAKRCNFFWMKQDMTIQAHSNSIKRGNRNVHPWQRRLHCAHSTGKLFQRTIKPCGY